jgi:hypothetical protein
MGKVPNHKAKKGHNKKGALPFKRARLERFNNRHIDQVCRRALVLTTLRQRVLPGGTRHPSIATATRRRRRCGVNAAAAGKSVLS